MKINILEYISRFNLESSLGFGLDLMILNIISLLMLLVIFQINMARQKIQLVFLSSLVSIFMVLLYLAMDAPDVAMTETSINACLSTMIMLVILKKMGDVDNIKKEESYLDHLFAFIICICISVFFIYISADLNNFSSPFANIHNGVSKYYVDNTISDIGIPSVVCAILASYRGFDTMGETAVIATAMLSVLFILSIKKEEKGV